MHGTIFVELEKFVGARLGEGAWNTLKAQAGIDPGRTYDVFETYPDEEVFALVTTGSAITGIPVPGLLEAFGEFIAPDLLEMYWGAIQPEWRTLDVIEHTESTIHTVVRLNQRGSTPPYLRATRTAPNEVTVHYTSARKLCFVAKGITHGIAKHFNETITVEDARCMHRGDDDCVLIVRKQD
ncbi:MAG TPA: heme NO-binding domain-containing protein [Thermoanaerobaculia bacterium]